MNLDQLFEYCVRPPGGGIPAFSTGKGSEIELQEKIYGHTDAALIEKAWKESLNRLKSAKAVVVGLPLDTGAGIRRGAAYGPRGVRTALLKSKDYLQWLKSGELVDLGDIWVNPHLLHDSMLSADQIQLCQRAMYQGEPLPVSGLSIAEEIYKGIWKEFPHLKINLIGGDHSGAWPLSKVCLERYGKTLGIVQPDAHTDLLDSRLGVQYCFATWSYHANEMMGRDGRLVQVGIRHSGKDKAHWESTLGVKQLWAYEINADESGAIEQIIQQLKERGVKQLYFSNDIDGTDEAEAPATGTPASEGVSSKFMLELMDRLGQEFDWVAADIMEVAPDLAKSESEKEKTLNLAASYLLKGLSFQLG